MATVGCSGGACLFMVLTELWVAWFYRTMTELSTDAVSTYPFNGACAAHVLPRAAGVYADLQCRQRCPYPPRDCIEGASGPPDAIRGRLRGLGVAARATRGLTFILGHRHVPSGRSDNAVHMCCFSSPASCGPGNKPQVQAVVRCQPIQDVQAVLGGQPLPGWVVNVSVRLREANHTSLVLAEVSPNQS